MTTAMPWTLDESSRWDGSRAFAFPTAWDLRSTGTANMRLGGVHEKAPISGTFTARITAASLKVQCPSEVRVLITGAGGQLGQELIKVLSDLELHPLDHRSLDICDRRAVQAALDNLR